MEFANNIKASCSPNNYLVTLRCEIEAATVQIIIYSMADKMQ